MKRYDYDHVDVGEHKRHPVSVECPVCLYWVKDTVEIEVKRGYPIFDRKAGYQEPIAWAHDKQTAQRIVDALINLEEHEAAVRSPEELHVLAKNVSSD